MPQYLLSLYMTLEWALDDRASAMCCHCKLNATTVPHAITAVRSEQAVHTSHTPSPLGPDRNQLFGMGVADGVYGWRDVGIDSGVMSQTLMQRCMAMIQSGVEDVYKSEHTHTAGAQNLNCCMAMIQSGIEDRYTCHS